MQREDEKLNMPGGFKSNRADASYNNNNNTRLSGAVAGTQSASTATPMRATNVINPSGSSFEVAGPTMGGTPSPFSSDRMEQAKEHLADSFSGLNHDSAADNNTLNVSSTGTGHARRPSLTDTVLSGASSAATGAAAAGASVIAAAKKLIHHGDDEHAVLQEGYENHNTVSALGTESPTKFNPGDRAPLKVEIHAKKPSDKATYGNLDSPGATNRPGPLSERALAGTVPMNEVPKTIADPFGPVKVTNWNDGPHQREPEVSTPKAEDFESYFGSPHGYEPLKDYTEKSLSAPSAVASVPAIHKSSSATPADVTRNHSGLRNEVHNEISSASAHAPIHHNARASATIAALGAAGTTTAIAGHHQDVTSAQSIPYNTAPIVTTTTTAQRIPIAQPPTQNQEFKQTIRQIPIAQPPAGISHPTQTSTNTYQHQPQQYNIAPAAAAATVAGAAATAVPLAMRSNATPTAAAAQPKDSMMDKVKNVLHRDSAPSASTGHYEIANDTTAQVALTDASVLLAQQEYTAKHHSQPNALGSQPNANIAAAAAAPINTVAAAPMNAAYVAPINTTASGPKFGAAAPAMGAAAAGTAAAGVAAVHHHHHHHQPATEATVPITHNTATIATTSAAPLRTVNKMEELPVSQYDAQYQSSLPLHRSIPLVHHTTTPVHTTTTSTANKMAAPIMAMTAGTTAGVAALLHKEDTATPRRHVDSEIVDRTLPAGSTEHKAYLAKNPTQVNAAPANVYTTSTATAAPAPAVNLHHSSAVPITVASAAAPAAYAASGDLKQYAASGDLKQHAASGDLKQHVFTPVDNSMHKTAAPVQAPTFDTRYMNLNAPTHQATSMSNTTAVPVMKKTTTTTTTVQDQTHRPLTENIAAPILGAAAVTGAASLAQQHTTSRTTTATTPASVKPLEHVEYTLKPSDVHPITSSSISNTSAPVVTPYIANTATTNPVLSAPHAAMPATIAAASVPAVNMNKNTTTTTNVPIQQQQQYHTTTTTAPIQQQQQQYHPTTTTAPIQQQQQQYHPTTTNVPVQQQQQQNTTSAVHTPGATVAPIAAAATLGAAAVGVNNYRPSTTTTTSNTTNNNGYNSSTRMAPTALGITPTTLSTHKGTSSTEIDSANKIASAIPESYHGPVPQLHSGEELVWLKTTTTTEVYGDGTPVDGNSDAHDKVVYSNNLSNNNNNINNNGYVNQQQQQLQPPQQQQGGRRHSGSFIDRLFGRQPGVDKGKGRL